MKTERKKQLNEQFVDFVKQMVKKPYKTLQLFYNINTIIFELHKKKKPRPRVGKMEQPQNSTDKKSKEIVELEKEVAIGLWIQVIGQIIEIKGLTGLLILEDDSNQIGEQQILTGVWIRTIGSILEAISVTKQISETDLTRLLQEQKIAITGDLLSSIGSALEVNGGILVLEEEQIKAPRIIP
ncbi:hypothetical protein [Bacillus sp. JJ722]|uniref:hypothetical protein n=1 Tax=Bacillus sp. JJ722 TaxID=3122973 RepID=UPI002FFE6A94